MEFYIFLQNFIDKEQKDSALLSSGRYKMCDYVSYALNLNYGTMSNKEEKKAKELFFFQLATRRNIRCHRKDCEWNKAHYENFSNHLDIVMAFSNSK
jgi:hypothetical protein